MPEAQKLPVAYKAVILLRELTRVGPVFKAMLASLLRNER